MTGVVSVCLASSVWHTECQCPQASLSSSTICKEVSSSGLQLTYAMHRIAFVANYWQCHWDQSIAH